MSSEKKRKGAPANQRRRGRPPLAAAEAQVAAAEAAPEGVGNWDKWVMAAAFRMAGQSQEAAAKAAGISERTLWGWENEYPALWKKAKSEARERWLSDVEIAARAAVFLSVSRGNAALGLTVLERLDEAFRPPALQLKHSGTGPGGGIVLNVIGPHSAPPGFGAGVEVRPLDAPLPLPPGDGEP